MVEINADRCRALAAHLRALPERAPRFDANQWYSTPRGRGLTNVHQAEAYHDDCGTAACMAGHAIWLFGAPPNAGPGTYIQDAAQELLGLDERQATRLFLPWWLELVQSPTEIDAARAAGVLERLAKTGEVMW